MSRDLTSISFNNASGKATNLGEYRGQVLLVVNVASECGLTPQYEGLETIFEKYNDNGFQVLAFPANEFGAQEPGTNAEIQSFCRSTYGVKFPVMEKVVVKGDGQHPLFKELTETKKEKTINEGSKLVEYLKAKNLLNGNAHDIWWNFEKFLVNKNGEVVERFAPDIEPTNTIVTAAIERELKK